MRWSSVIAVHVLAAALVLALQPAANSAGGTVVAQGWQAQVAADDGGPQEVSPQSFEALRAKLEPDDPVAVLEAIGYALDTVADGATYIWHRTDGPLMGNVRMLGSFRGADGGVCRRLTVTLILGNDSRPIDTTACRNAIGHWVMTG